MHGLYLTWWVQEQHLAPVVVGIALAAGDLALVAFELPTGWFADRLGHRVSLILGSVIQVAGMLFCWLGSGVPGLVAASLLVALGDAFRSGADHALLYRTCVALGREGDFQRIEARCRAAELAALVGLVVAGGAIVSTWGFAWGWIVEVALAALGVVLACAMVEPPRVSTDDIAPLAVQAPFGSMRLMALILPAAVVAALGSAAAFFLQTSSSTSAREVTTIVAAITLTEALGAAVAMRLPASGARTQLLLGIVGLLIMALMSMAPSTSVAVTLALSFLMGLAEPLRAAAVQRVAGDQVRARAASLTSACDKAFMTAALPLAGWRATIR